MIREFYDRMARYARFMEKRCGKSSKIFGEKIKLSEENAKYLVNAGQSYGEWAEPEDVCAFKWQDFVAPHPEVSTAYTAYVLGLMAEIADELGQGSDAEEFRSYSEGCRNAYQELVSGGKYTLDSDRQAQLVRPLALGLLNDKQKENRIKNRMLPVKYRKASGFLFIKVRIWKRTPAGLVHCWQVYRKLLQLHARKRFVPVKRRKRSGFHLQRWRSYLLSC